MRLVNAGVAARYQRVTAAIVLPEFPRNAAGKTLKRKMRDPYRAGRATKL
ncbi:MAG: hypothetical protein Q8J96_14685 [Rhodocyclaceae bacterium]|nr:hypothetical protein [Rhodocyclaceae bacterium]MDP3030670.1 hypothetical protein [Rhodocyclaceae bacterium]